MARFAGIHTAMVTPFDAEGRVDPDRAVALARHLLTSGSDGLVVAATTGEAAVLDDDEHIGLVRLIVEAVGGEHVIAGTGSNDTRHAIELTERAVASGARAVLSVTPYYNKPNRRGILRHFAEVARAAAPAPVVLYNIPGRTGTDMPNDLLAELAQIDGIEGVKQANPDNLALVDGLEILAGNDDLVAPCLDIGGVGGICVASHFVGAQLRRMIDEPQERRAIHEHLLTLFNGLFETSSPILTKAALNLLGHEVGGVRLPLDSADESEIAHVRGLLERYELLERAAS